LDFRAGMDAVRTDKFPPPAGTRTPAYTVPVSLNIGTKKTDIFYSFKICRNHGW